MPQRNRSRRFVRKVLHAMDPIRYFRRLFISTSTETMTRKFLLIACLSGMFAVALGAFAAHILKKVLTDHQIQIFDTGVRYQFYHTIVLIAVAILGRYVSKRWAEIAGWLFVSGIALFSGSLYLLALVEFLEMPDLATLAGPITPIGGVLLIAGWAALFRACFDYKGRSRPH
ncbi:MAG: DUF423 domain-containing protein [Saprospiraceae bacterium]|nr:DUF423 domain-containing protein [Saprospiraceae bacterium]